MRISDWSSDVCSSDLVMAGSHLDSQPTGGKFDGAYGVLAGLEVLRTLNDGGVETEAPVEVVVWTNEEGSRFAPAMMGRSEERRVGTTCVSPCRSQWSSSH